MKTFALIVCGFILGGLTTARAEFIGNNSFQQFVEDFHQVTYDIRQIRQKYDRDSGCR